ncbi:MAG: hypothetical protein JST89_03790 [Cyanobacteria bacterium SZAS-4]|nr:hypothetical protein [Cyanobacteria bacterium SZAS-4]
MDNTPAVIEKELLKKAPRRIVNRNGKWGDIAPWLILLLPHVWVAVIAPLAWLGIMANAFAAEPFAAKITNLHQGRYKNKDTYTIAYEFSVDNKVTKAHAKVDKSRFESLKDGDTITIYTARWFPWYAPRLEKDPTSMLPILAFLTVWCLIWCGAMFGIVFAVLDQPLRSKHLAKYGIPTLATVEEIRSMQGRTSKNYQILYKYEAKTVDKKTGKKITAKFNGKMTIKSMDVYEAEELKGQQVTVLIDEKSPKKSILYRFCAHQALG